MMPLRAPGAAGTAATPGTAGAAHLTAPTRLLLERVTDASRAMGGGLAVHVAARPGEHEAAARDAARVADRVRAWARQLTRHDPGSALMRLNADPSPHVRVSPILAATLAWAEEATALTDGVVDPTLFGERLAAETGAAGAAEPGAPGTPGAATSPTAAPTTLTAPARAAALAPADRTWRLASPFRPRRGGLVDRRPGLRLDLDGVAKGWIADRALHLLDRHPGAIVDADGDIAVRVARGEAWEIGVADPRDPAMVLAILHLDRDAAGADGRLGVATSGISVHAWPDDANPGRHHLIDPRTGRPAATDVVQATVIASSAAAAEAWAKTAVILGGAVALERLQRAPVRGAILLLRDGRTVALPRTSRYLA